MHARSPSATPPLVGSSFISPQTGHTSNTAITTDASPFIFDMVTFLTMPSIESRPSSAAVNFSASDWFTANTISTLGTRSPEGASVSVDPSANLQVSSGVLSESSYPYADVGASGACGLVALHNLPTSLDTPWSSYGSAYKMDSRPFPLAGALPTAPYPQEANDSATSGCYSQSTAFSLADYDCDLMVRKV